VRDYVDLQLYGFLCFSFLLEVRNIVHVLCNTHIYLYFISTNCVFIVLYKFISLLCIHLHVSAIISHLQGNCLHEGISF